MDVFSYLLGKKASGGGGGGGSNIDWTQIGYENEPESIQNGFNYAKEIKNNWDSSITSCYNKYYNNKFLQYFPLVDTSNVTSFSNMFEECISLQKVPELNMEKASNINRMFYDCKVLREAGDIDIKTTTGTVYMQKTFFNCTCLEKAPMITTKRRADLTNIFYQCENLKHVPQFDIGTSDRVIVTMNSAFTNCPNLTNESLNNIMGILKNVLYLGQPKTLRALGFSSEQSTICTTLSNWEDLANDGWTTGN